ncbi:MAG: type I restriction enzyme HsdR N-terminal domain-containing protein, partial [Bacteroidota bacterium]
MKSCARLHFPPVRWNGQERRLWNRVWRRSCKDLPEERVRLQFLDWLLLQQAWPAGHIASERSLSDRHSQRTDLLCHNEKGEPAWLIECKAPSVRMGESASIQIARYNRVVGASVLCLTNGVFDYWYRVSDETLIELDSPPTPDRVLIETIRDPAIYWVDRGFLGNRSPEPFRNKLAALCRDLYNPDHASSIFYLDGEWRTDHLSLSHYYRAFNPDPARQIAIAILSDATGSTWISVLHNEKSQTTAMFQIPIQPSEQSGEPTDKLHYFLTDTNGRIRL